jgi:Mlc titration factor MtfA (ptsG expression regulator)
MVFGLVKRKRREHLRAQPFPQAWRDLLLDRVPLYRRLPAADRKELHGLMQIFLGEKNFEGCAGLELADEMRLVVAAQACVLLLHREMDIFPRLASILLYPETYVAPRTYEEDGLVTEGEEEMAGESWAEGALVLSWSDIIEDLESPGDGYNVILHEFAHQLDDETGAADGMPVMPDRRLAEEWAVIMQREFEQLQDDLQAGRPIFLDDYGASDPTEFFACTTELFFELPQDFQEEHAELYDLLARYYRQDPAAWPEV